MSVVFGTDGSGLDPEQVREVFPEDQIQLIGIETRVFES